jgi:hypothetical protein
LEKWKAKKTSAARGSVSSSASAKPDFSFDIGLRDDAFFTLRTNHSVRLRASLPPADDRRRDANSLHIVCKSDGVGE